MNFNNKLKIYNFLNNIYKKMKALLILEIIKYYHKYQNFYLKKLKNWEIYKLQNKFLEKTTKLTKK